VVSLTPFRLPASLGEANQLLPVVFLCPPFEHCAPKVCADVRDAYYDLTCRAIGAGHSRIVFSEDAFEPDPRQTAMHREGYLEAMAEHGLEVDQEFMERSRSVANHEWKTVQAHLSEIMDMTPGCRPEVVVAGSLGRNMAMNREAGRLNIAIPDTFSIVSIGSAQLEGRPRRRLTGMLPDFDCMVDLCFEMLKEQKETGRSDFTKVHVRMHYVPGDTLKTPEPADSPERKIREGADLLALSRAVQ
jgi:DNA-binding LacI/PurR family transcriptional regulator